MKKTFLTGCVIAAMLLIACNKEKDTVQIAPESTIPIGAKICYDIESDRIDTINPTSVNQLHGKWQLQFATGGIAGDQHTFDPSQVVWNFSSAENSISITNNYKGDFICSGQESGNHRFLILQADNTKFMAFKNGLCFQIIELTDSTLRLAQCDISDGCDLHFVK